MFQINRTIDTLLIGLIAFMSPAFAGVAAATIEYGNFTFTKPLISINYAMSQNNNAVFALAITHSDQMAAVFKNNSKAGLTESTAILVNCKSDLFTASFGYDAGDYKKAAETIAADFCAFHKKTWKHSFWQ